MRLKSMDAEGSSYLLSVTGKINAMIRLREHKEKIPPKQLIYAGQSRGLRC